MFLFSGLMLIGRYKNYKAFLPPTFLSKLTSALLLYMLNFPKKKHLQYDLPKIKVLHNYISMVITTISVLTRNKV